MVDAVDDGFALGDQADARLVAVLKQAAARAGLAWRETNHLALRRGPYWVGAGLDESVPGPPMTLRGRFVNLLDPGLRLQRSFTLAPGSRCFLLDLDALKASSPRVLASACKALPQQRGPARFTWAVEGIADTPAIVLIACAKPPQAVTLDGTAITTFTHSAADGLLHIRFPNESRPRELAVTF